MKAGIVACWAGFWEQGDGLRAHRRTPLGLGAGTCGGLSAHSALPNTASTPRPQTLYPYRHTIVSIGNPWHSHLLAATFYPQGSKSSWQLVRVADRVPWFASFELARIEREPPT